MIPNQMIKSYKTQKALRVQQYAHHKLLHSNCHWISAILVQ